MIIAEGYGEVRAGGVLAARVLIDHGSIGAPFDVVPPPRRMPVLRPTDLERACDVARSQRPAALLVTSDLEDDYPATEAPEMARRIRTFQLPFPAAVVLFYREYETLFVAAANALSKRTLHMTSGPLALAVPNTTIKDPESRRDAKGWVSDNLLSGTRYKPTVHQEPMTRALTIAELRATGLSSFRRLESGLRHLSDEVGRGNTGVYP